jgi:ubiquinone biosynthesis protein
VIAAQDLGDLIRGWELFTALPVMLLVALIAGRLLGVRRSFGATIASGVIGWLAGATLSLVIAHSEGRAGFTRNLWLFSTFFAMSTTAWIELLAKPGALARARTGLASVPRPLRSARLASQRLGRYAQITRIAVRYGFGSTLGLGDGEVDEQGVAGKAPVAVRLRRALEECGGMFVKLGQVLSTRSDLLPDHVVAELSRLQDRVAQEPRPAMQTVVEEDLGGPVETFFADFDWQPIAAASIGQAYKARLKSGEPVIVKVQRPGIAAAVERDMGVLLELARTAEARTSWAAEYRVLDLANEFADRLREELDFRIEARNATLIGGRIGDGTGGGTRDGTGDGDGTAPVRVPRVYDELTTARVLTMEWLDGVSVRQTDRVDALGVDRPALAEALLRCSLQQMLVDGHFHADPHPGNVLVLGPNQLGLIDFGATGRLDAVEQSSLREMVLAVSQRDATLMRQAVLEVASLRRGFDDEQLERSLARFMARNLGPGATPTAAMFNELLQLFFAFGITLPPEFSTFFRAMITLEGTLTTLCPGYLVIDAAQGIAKEWARDRLTPASLQDLARQELLSLAPMLRRMPRHVDRLATIVERGDVRANVSLFRDTEDVRVVTRLVNRVVVAFLGGVVGVISVILLGVQGGPAFTGTTSLYQFFGYFGLFCSTVLVLRVLVAVLRDGLN